MAATENQYTYNTHTIPKREIRKEKGEKGKKQPAAAAQLPLTECLPRARQAPS